MSSLPRSYKIRPIRAVTDYFGDAKAIPVIVQTFVPGRGWARYPFAKRMSRAWGYKLRAEGVTHVALSYDGRVADFRIQEVS